MLDDNIGAANAAVLATRAELIAAAAATPERAMDDALASSLAAPDGPLPVGGRDYMTDAHDEVKALLRNLVARSADLPAQEIQAGYAAAVAIAKAALNHGSKQTEAVQHHGFVARDLEAMIRARVVTRLDVLTTLRKLTADDLEMIVSSRGSKDVSSIAGICLSGDEQVRAAEAGFRAEFQAEVQAAMRVAPSTRAASELPRVAVDLAPLNPAASARKETGEKLDLMLSALSKPLAQSQDDIAVVLAVRDAWKPVAEMLFAGGVGQAMLSPQLRDAYLGELRPLVNDRLKNMSGDELVRLKQGLDARKKSRAFEHGSGHFDLVQKALVAELVRRPLLTADDFIAASAAGSFEMKRQYQDTQAAAHKTVRAERLATAALWTPRRRGVGEAATQLGRRALNAVTPGGRSESKIQVSREQAQRKVGELLGALLRPKDDPVKDRLAVSRLCLDIKQAMAPGMSGLPVRMDAENDAALVSAVYKNELRSHLRHYFDLATNDQLLLLQQSLGNHGAESELLKPADPTSTVIQEILAEYLATGIDASTGPGPATGAVRAPNAIVAKQIQRIAGSLNSGADNTASLLGPNRVGTYIGLEQLSGCTPQQRAKLAHVANAAALKEIADAVVNPRLPNGATGSLMGGQSRSTFHVALDPDGNLRVRCKRVTNAPLFAAHDKSTPIPLSKGEARLEFEIIISAKGVVSLGDRVPVRAEHVVIAEPIPSRPPLVDVVSDEERPSQTPLDVLMSPGSAPADLDRGMQALINLQRDLRAANRTVVWSVIKLEDYLRSHLEAMPKDQLQNLNVRLKQIQGYAQSRTPPVKGWQKEGSRALAALSKAVTASLSDRVRALAQVSGTAAPKAAIASPRQAQDRLIWALVGLVSNKPANRRGRALCANSGRDRGASEQSTRWRPARDRSAPRRFRARGGERAPREHGAHHGQR